MPKELISYKIGGRYAFKEIQVCISYKNSHYNILNLLKNSINSLYFSRYSPRYSPNMISNIISFMKKGQNP